MATESYINLDLGDAGVVKVAAVDLGGGGLVKDTGDLTEPATKLLGPIEAVSKGVMDALKKAQPTSFTVELDFTVGIESGGMTLIFGKASGSATVKATLVWDKGTG